MKLEYVQRQCFVYDQIWGRLFLHNYSHFVWVNTTVRRDCPRPSQIYTQAYIINKQPKYESYGWLIEKHN